MVARLTNRTWQVAVMPVLPSVPLQVLSLNRFITYFVQEFGIIKSFGD
jgi:hypothetical protein